jgi:serine phosphatase RsbU (regulator of sigma subunit)
MIEFKPDKMPVGKYHGELNSFSLQKVDLQKGDIVYCFTDGFADQFGGEKGKKFKYKPFQQFLINNAQLPMETQKNVLDSTFEKWKGDLEQVDDVLVVGVKI